MPVMWGRPWPRLIDAADLAEGWDAGSMRRLLVVLVLASLLLSLSSAAIAQDSPSTTDAVGQSRPRILPRPNSGEAPQASGDRGGAAQLGLLAVVVVVIGGTVVHLVRQSQRIRSKEPNGHEGFGGPAH